MNAVIALCHFCEAHGPSAIFCTQMLRETNIEEFNFESQQLPSRLCAACNSTGQTGIISKDETTNANFVSTQVPIFSEVAMLIKQASVRSLSCEISSNKDGGFVYFGDASNGHILSHTFHVSDIQARGFYQLFSIIILMKDKFFLLNIKPFLAEHMKKISTDIQNMAKNIHDEEQAKVCPRERRVSGGSQLIPSTPRSLIDLTGEKNIFPIIHSNFTWLFLAGSCWLTEHLTFGNMPWLPNKIDVKEFANKTTETDLDDSQDLDTYSLRQMKELMGDEDFTKACFCAITGVKIIIRGPPNKTHFFTQCFKKLLPGKMYKLIQINSPKSLTNPDHRIVTVSSEIAVPIPTLSIFRIDFIEMEPREICVKWLGELPNKYPDLLVQILKATEEPLFTELVLDKRLKVLIEEWENKAKCIKKIKSSSDQIKLKKVLGIQVQDQPVLNYWQKILLS